MFVCVRLYADVCVCEKETEAGERQREGDTQTDRD